MSCCKTYDPCLDGKLNQIGSYASVARTSAQSAQASAQSAQASATSAQNNATLVQNLYDDFSEKYLGSFSSPPAPPIEDGALYFDTTTNGLFVWDGSTWIALPTGFDEFTNFMLPSATPLAASNLVNGKEYEIAVIGDTPWASIGASSPTVGARFTKTGPAGTGTGTARATRDLVTRFADFANVKDYGAVGDGVADDTAAIQAAVNASNSVYFPPGVYVSSQIVVANKNIVLFGDAPEVCEIRFVSVAKGIEITQNSKTYVAYIYNLSFNTTGAGGTALELSWPAAIGDYTSRYDYRSIIQNCIFKGVNPLTQGWQNGIVYSEAVNVSVIGCSFRGIDQNIGTQPTLFISQKAISFAGQTFGVPAVELNIEYCKITSFDIGVNIENWSEGIYVDNCTFLFCRCGIKWDSDPSSSGRPLLLTSNSHFNVYENAIRTNGSVQSFIHNNLIYSAVGGNQTSNLLKFINARQIDVHNNQFYSFTTVQSTNGIVVGGNVSRSKIAQNYFQNLGTNFAIGIHLQLGLGTEYNSLYDNRFDGIFSVGAIVDDSQSGGVNNTSWGGGGSYVYSTTAVSIPNNTPTIVAFDTRAYDTNSFFSSPSSLIIPNNKGIKRARLSFCVTFDANPTGVRGVQIHKAGTPFAGTAIVSTNASVLSHGICGSTAIINVNDGDAFTLSVLQNSGGPLNVQGNGLTWLQIEVID